MILFIWLLFTLRISLRSWIFVHFAQNFIFTSIVYGDVAISYFWNWWKEIIFENGVRLAFRFGNILSISSCIEPKGYRRRARPRMSRLLLVYFLYFRMFRTRFSSRKLDVKTLMCLFGRSLVKYRFASVQVQIVAFFPKGAPQLRHHYYTTAQNWLPVFF